MAKRIAATAQNDNQNPAETTAHGSISNTSPSADASTAERGTLRLLRYASATTPAIHSARCTGTLKPAKAACNAAKSAPPVTATNCAGTCSGQLRPINPERRQHAPQSHAARPAAKPICNPEIATR